MSIPIQIQEGDVESGRFYVPCEFDGIQAQFHLDTGSSYTSVSWDRNTAKYPVFGTKTRSSASGREKADQTIRVREFSFGDLKKRDLELVRYSQLENQENRLGLSVLSGSRLSFDFKNNFLATSTWNGMSTRPLHRDHHGLFYIETSLDEVLLRTLWDTGAELTVIDPELILKKPKLFNHVMNIDQGTDATGALVQFKLFRCADLKVGGISLEGNILSMDFAPLRRKIGEEVCLILGFNHIRKLNWNFDLNSNLWSVAT